MLAVETSKILHMQNLLVPQDSKVLEAFYCPQKSLFLGILKFRIGYEGRIYEVDSFL